jgi:lipopolysaccharide transport system ATP-binding protein
VGTGFHPELSGRENIFLNGAILGMTKKEIKSKFDEIVDFAGVERYIDTPVKRYSSGMYVRLAFAVAAHLEPEILIVDEVLAVGDAEFQKKCLGKMKDVSERDGRTVLFVSHNMGAINQLCEKALLLNNGMIVVHDSVSRVVDQYIRQNSTTDKVLRKSAQKGVIHFTEIFMTDGQGELRYDYKFNEEIIIHVELHTPKDVEVLELALRLTNSSQQGVFTIHEPVRGFVQNSVGKVNIRIPRMTLTPGTYSWIMCINHPGTILHDLREFVAPFEILETGSEFTRYKGTDFGSVYASYQLEDLLLKGNEKDN